MSLSTTFASLSAVAAPVAPIAHAVPTFKFGSSKDYPFVAQLTTDLYAAKGAPGYSSALWDALDTAGVAYRAGIKILVKVYAAGKRTSQFATAGALARTEGESITAWLDRVEMHPDTRGIGVEVKAAEMTQAQVKFLFRACGPCKFDPAGTAKLVRAFTFIAPPVLPSEADFAPTIIDGDLREDSVDAVAPIEHREFAGPILRVPAGHVEPAFPLPEQHVEYVSPVEYPVEPIVADEPIPADDSVTIVEEELLDARTLRELGSIWKQEFGFTAPSKIRKEDLITLINAKRAVA